MISPSILKAAIVEKLQSISALVDELHGDEELIYEYDDTYPIMETLTAAIRKMKSPSVMVRYRGLTRLTPGGAFGHALTLYLRPAADASYSDLAYTLMTGIPSGETLEFYNLQLYAGLLPPRFEGEIAPQVDEEGVEFMEINFTLEEM